MSGVGYMAFGSFLKKTDAIKRMDDCSKARLWMAWMLGMTVYTYTAMKLPGINMRTGKWPLFPISYIIAFAGLILFAILSFLLTKYLPRLGKGLQYVGKNSMIFVCTNHPAILVGRKIVGLFCRGETAVSHILIFLTAVLVIIALSEIFNRTFLRVFIGKPMKEGN